MLLTRHCERDDWMCVVGPCPGSAGLFTLQLVYEPKRDSKRNKKQSTQTKIKLFIKTTFKTA